MKWRTPISPKWDRLKSWRLGGEERKGTVCNEDKEKRRKEGGTKRREDGESAGQRYKVQDKKEEEEKKEKKSRMETIDEATQLRLTASRF